MRFGTLAPERRASLRPIAMACLRFVTFLPEPPDLSFPCFISSIARRTFSLDFGPYFRPDFLRDAVFLRDDPLRSELFLREVDFLRVAMTCYPLLPSFRRANLVRSAD